MMLFQRDYDLGFEYAVKLARVERSVPSEIGATAKRFAGASEAKALQAYAAGMVDAALAMVQS